MGKKVKEYKAGDFIFAKVKGYPAWPARVQKPNGKKYFVYFYGTGETANLPPNQIFDYAENKDKFLTKTIKRKDFNDGARQIEQDFANKVPLENIIGVNPQQEPMDTSANDMTGDDSAFDNTAADETIADDHDTVEDSDEGALVIDEGKKGRKSTAKAPATPKSAKEPKTPRGKQKKEDSSAKEKEGEGQKKEEEFISRSGRKIRPKRYLDEQTEENTTLPTPASKKRRVPSPAVEKQKEKEKEKPEKTKKVEPAPAEKPAKHYTAVSQAELEDLKEPFHSETTSSQNGKRAEKKIVPTFGKKRKNGQKNVTEAKFKPTHQVASEENNFTLPVNCNLKENATFLEQSEDLSRPEDFPELSNMNASQESATKLTNFSTKETSHQARDVDVNIFKSHTENITADENSTFENNSFIPPIAQNSHENYQANVAKVKNTVPLKTKTSFTLGNLICGSLNLVNDEDLILSQHSDKNPVLNLSQTKSVESFCSVTSLAKTYKDLDIRSFENAASSAALETTEMEGSTLQEETVTEKPENAVKTLEKYEYKIPHGENFLKMFRDFKVPCNKNKHVAMSILLGDMGPDVSYGDYVKRNTGLVAFPTEEDDNKDHILIAYLPSGHYVGIKLFQHRPMNFKSDTARLAWDRQAAANRIALKLQLEKGHITPHSVITQLEMDLNLTDEEKANLDKEREIDDKKSRVQFLKTEMKLIELDAKIKSCLSLEKADTDTCLKLLDELMELDLRCLMLLKHPTCLETVKRMRAYVGNTPSWELSEADALLFSKQASLIRRQADAAYRKLKDLFTPPEGLSFWEYFSERVVVFKRCTAHLSGDERLEMIHEPLEMTMPTSHTMRTAIDEANEEVAPDLDDSPPKKLKTPPKTKKGANSTPAKSAKRQTARSKTTEPEKDAEDSDQAQEEPEKYVEKQSKHLEIEKDIIYVIEDSLEDSSESAKATPEPSGGAETEDKADGAAVTDKEKGPNATDKNDDEAQSETARDKGAEKKGDAQGNKRDKEGDKDKKDKAETEKEDLLVPRAKRVRESNKKTDPPPKSPTKRKSRS